MATLRVCLKHPAYRFKSLVSPRLIGTTAVNFKEPTKYDFKPGKYPTTPEERIAAAKKYGLHIDDYMPRKDEGLGAGDYPDLEPKSFSARDPYHDWDYPFVRRDYNEVRYSHDEYLKGHRYDESHRYVVPLGRQALYFLAFFTGAALLHFNLPVNFTYAPMMAKQYPYGSLHLERGGDPSNVPTIKHYTFEPAEELDDEILD